MPNQDFINFPTDSVISWTWISSLDDKFTWASLCQIKILASSAFQPIRLQAEPGFLVWMINLHEHHYAKSRYLLRQLPNRFDKKLFSSWTRISSLDDKFTFVSLCQVWTLALSPSKLILFQAISSWTWIYSSDDKYAATFLHSCSSIKPTLHCPSECEGQKHLVNAAGSIVWYLSMLPFLFIWNTKKPAHLTDPRFTAQVNLKDMFI